MSNMEIPPARRVYWSVRRELWENRSIYLAPLAAACMVLVGFFIGLFTLPARMRAALALSPPELRQAIEQPFVIGAIILMAVDLLVAIFYSLDALYGERRDRSVLFWKSLPVSDLTAVLSKASIPILVLPLVTFVATAATQAVMLLASSLVLAASGTSAAPLWAHVSLLDISRVNFGHLVGFHGIWYAPLYAWLLLASAWATRVPFLWAALPPVAIGVVERIAFNSTHFATLVQNHFLGGPESTPTAGAPAMTMEMLAAHPLGHFLISPGLWVGLALSAVFLLGAVRLRRSRGAI
jgi:ABC-2 type transport system permease protein